MRTSSLLSLSLAALAGTASGHGTGGKQNEANALIEQLQRKSERIGNLITLLNASWSNGECIGDEKINELLNEVEY